MYKIASLGPVPDMVEGESYFEREMLREEGKGIKVLLGYSGYFGFQPMITLG